MSAGNPNALRELAVDIELELAYLTKLESQIRRVRESIGQVPVYADLFYESLALKFHNFYTSCERIFSLISVELNGGVYKNADWQRHLLARMVVERGDRKAVITADTAQLIQEFLAFRHVVRNIYGFELDIKRLNRLLEKYPPAWNQLEREI
ncbi:MAG: hypothetical protein WBB01_09560 [Phormidesmis sp.]